MMGTYLLQPKQFPSDSFQFPSPGIFPCTKFEKAVKEGRIAFSCGENQKRIVEFDWESTGELFASHYTSSNAVNSKPLVTQVNRTLLRNRLAVRRNMVDIYQKSVLLKKIICNPAHGYFKDIVAQKHQPRALRPFGGAKT
jgi:hypothetical protein